MASMTDTAVAITSLYEQWFAAIPGHDYDFVERTFREDWIYTDQFGAVRDRQEYIGIWRALVADDHVDELQEIEVRDLGEVG
jgi:ketosteroid isomerase-like protein